MALKISLKPGERFVVNGAVLANGDRRASLVIQNKVSLLRERDILTESEVNTPARRVYFPIMLSYLDQDNAGRYYEEFIQRMMEFMNAVESQDALALCVEISAEVMNRQYYRALVNCKKLFKFEEERLSHVPGCVSQGTDSLGVAAAD
ncbi:MAG: flagellar biosynthesis repressor FlbT [Pseudomonadota bacterium]